MFDHCPVIFRWRPLLHDPCSVRCSSSSICCLLLLWQSKEFSYVYLFICECSSALHDSKNVSRSCWCGRNNLIWLQWLHVVVLSTWNVVYMCMCCLFGVCMYVCMSLSIYVSVWLVIAETDITGTLALMPRISRCHVCSVDLSVIIIDRHLQSLTLLAGYDWGRAAYCRGRHRCPWRLDRLLTEPDDH